MRCQVKRQRRFLGEAESKAMVACDFAVAVTLPFSDMFAGHFGVFWMSVQANWAIRAGEMHLFVSWTS